MSLLPESIATTKNFLLDEAYRLAHPSKEKLLAWSVGGVLLALGSTEASAQEPVTPESQPGNGSTSGPIFETKRTTIFGTPIDGSFTFYPGQIQIDLQPNQNLAENQVATTGNTGSPINPDKIILRAMNRLGTKPLKDSLGNDLPIGRQYQINGYYYEPVPEAIAEIPMVNNPDGTISLSYDALNGNVNPALPYQLCAIFPRAKTIEECMIIDVREALNIKKPGKESQNNTTPDLDSPEGNGPFIPQPQTGIRTESNSPYSTFGGLKRSRGIV